MNSDCLQFVCACTEAYFFSVDQAGFPFSIGVIHMEVLMIRILTAELLMVPRQTAAGDDRLLIA